MGYVVLHINKVSGNDSGMTAHIERTIDPKNADKTRSHLNKELVKFPAGVTDRTQAIQHHLDTAGLTRKIGTNQVRALRVMLSGSPEDMGCIEATGKLDDWCADNLNWLRQTYGKDNVVSAVLHMDEKTPHIHATVVPIVTGERRKVTEHTKSTNSTTPGKKQYRKKSSAAPRLCADDVMARDKLSDYQTSYAAAMNKYGLQRGIVGSEARHITNQQFYRDLVVQKEDLQEDVEILTEQKAEVNDKIPDLYDRKDEAREKFLEIDNHVRQREQELSTIEAKLQTAKREYEPYKTREELNTIHKLFPMMKEQLRIAELCERIGLKLEPICALLSGRTLKGSAAKFYSPEHKQYFETEEVQLKIDKEPDDPNRLRLSLNGQNILDWFRQKYEELQQKLDVKPQQTPAPHQNQNPNQSQYPRQSKGMKF